jgi:hypothetical protein
VSRGRPAQDPVARFWSKVEKTDGCWIWRGERLPAGYGKIKIAGGYWLAHRYSKVIERGALSDEFQVCHECDNPSCVRPDHLFLGTPSDNAEDMVVKGRSAGQLTPDQVAELRSGMLPGATPQEFAAHFGVSRNVIYDVLRFNTYRSIGGEIEFDDD